MKNKQGLVVEYCKYTDRLPGLWQDNIHHFGRADRTWGVTLQHEIQPRLSMPVPPSHQCLLAKERGPGGNSGCIFKLSCAVERRRGKPVCCRLVKQRDLPQMAALHLVTWLEAQQHFPSTLAGDCWVSAAQDPRQWGIRSPGCSLFVGTEVTLARGGPCSRHLAKAKSSPILF